MRVTMAWANIGETAKSYVNDVLASGWLSRRKYIPDFEQAVAKKHGAKFGVFVNSGTDALRISLATLKETEQWPDRSQVLVPALTFVATVNAVLQNNLTPVFCDVDPLTANLVVQSVPSAVRGIIPVHLFGLPAEVPQGNFNVVEDSCETFGVHTLKGDLAAFSFYMSHHVSTGVGGMILTNNPKYERLARSYMNHGRIDDGTHFKFGRIGSSSRATEMEAALGVAALERFDYELVCRRQLARAYLDAFESFEPFYLPPDNPAHSWMFFPVRLRKGKRDRLLAHLRKQGIESREAMPLINQPAFKRLYVKGTCPNAEAWTDHGLLLPLHPQMKQQDVSYVCKTVKAFYVRH